MRLFDLFWIVSIYILGMILFTIISFLIFPLKIILPFFILLVASVVIDFNQVDDIYEWILDRNFNYDIYLCAL